MSASSPSRPAQKSPGLGRGCQSIAHSALGVRAISGMDVQRALQMLYSGLDFSDPDNELSDEDLAELLRTEDDS